MKAKLMITMLVLNFHSLLLAQTADDYLNQGRSFLAATNIVAANSSFSNAVALSPGHPTANVFYAITRLLVLPSQAGGSNFLSRIGMPIPGRDIYHWTARLPVGPHDVPPTPAGVNANEFAAMLRTNILPAVIAAEANLAAVTDAGFVLNLTSNETRIADVTLDYGDIQLLRALLQAAEYVAYSTYAWNLDAQLAAIHTLYASNQLSVERVLMDYPSLLTYATTNDLAAARLAFQNGVSRYLAASQLIRSRATNVTRLFNYDAGQASAEEKFRLTLTDLVNSLSAAVTLTVETNYTVFMGSPFSGNHSLRSFLPWFRGNGFGLGTLPDSTFGGMIYGLTRMQEDDWLVRHLYLTKHLFSIPTIAPEMGLWGGRFHFPMNVAAGRGYVIQTSTNLRDWVDCGAFIALDGWHEFTDVNTAVLSDCFYRVVDRTGNLPPPANDTFAKRSTVPSMNVAVTSYTAGASFEPAETNWMSGAGHTVWWSWTSPVTAEVAVRASSSENNCWPINIFTGGSLNGLVLVASGYNEFRFNAQAGVTYQIAVDTCGVDSGVRFVISRPPTLMVISPLDNALYTLPANVTISGSASDPDGQIRQISVSAWPDLNFSTTGDSFSFQWTNVPGGWHDLYFEVTDDAGCRTWEYRSFRVHPVNDDFANATVISGAPLTVYGSNEGADGQAGEPSVPDYSVMSSVWWSWTPASNGPVTILCDLTNQSGNIVSLLGVYTGSVVSNLTPVAYGYGLASFTASFGQTYKIAVDSSDWGKARLRFIPTAPPIVAITNPLNGATFFGPTNIPISAQASDSDGSIAYVEFYADDSLIGTRFTPPYSVTWSNIFPNENYRWLTARAVDNAGVGVFSETVGVIVQPPAPPNDNFTNRTTISGTSVVTIGTNVGATSEAGEPFHWSSTGGKSVWWRWQAPNSGTVTITTSGSSFDTILAVYTGTTVASLGLVANNDDYSGYTSRVSFMATAGTVYQIAVDGYAASSGSITLNLNQP